MQKKIFLSYLIVIVLAIAISATAFWTKGYSYIHKKTKDYYLMQTQMLADTLLNTEVSSQEEYLQFVKEYSQKYKVRITLIDKSGTVIADSSKSSDLENHATREEIVRALKGENISLTRYSKTMGKEYSYSAVAVSNSYFNGVLRVSLPLSELKVFDSNLISSIYISLFLCLVVALIVAIYFTKILAKPIDEVTKAAEEISNGNYSIKIYTRDKDQIGRLANAFNLMTVTLKSNISKMTRSNIELEAMLSSMSNSVVAIDDSNAILFSNKAFYDLIKSKSKMLTGKSLYNVVRNATVFEAIDEVRADRADVIKESVVKEGILNLGKDKVIRVTATRLVKESGKCFGVLIMIEDITRIRKLVSLRSDFVSNVTHELKTPLTSIRGFIDTLRNGAIKDEEVTRRFLDIIDIEAERLYSLIQDILLLSEIESKRDYTAVANNVGDNVQDVIHLLQAKISDKVTLIYHQEPDLKPFYCNPDRIKQLLINILDNSIKYTEEGSITIECKEDSNYLVIRITDTGIGIEEKYLARIFERFYRVDQGRSRKQGGTGLGLSIVKHIVELYDGNINIESKIDVGTKFEIRLPYREI